MDSEQQAEAITAGARADVPTVSGLAEELRDGGRPGPIAPMLIAVSRRALYDGWDPGRRAELAATLRDHEQFGYARRLLGRVRRDGPDSEELRQQHALCTYKDMELAAARRLDRALQILTAGERLEDSTSAETLGIAGAIYKRKWEVDAKRADLESARWCYERGFGQVDDPERWYPGINAAFVSDQLAALAKQGLGGSDEAAGLRANADRIRADIVKDLKGGDGGWADATLGEAHFGLERFDDARQHLARTGEATNEIWRRESTAMQVAALAQLRGFDPGEAARALGALVGGHVGAIDRATTARWGWRCPAAASGRRCFTSGFSPGSPKATSCATSRCCRASPEARSSAPTTTSSCVGCCSPRKTTRSTTRTTSRSWSSSSRSSSTACSRNLRGRLSADVGDNWRMLSSRYSRTDRAAELFQQMFFSQVPNDARDDPATPWHMTDLPITPGGRKDFSLRYENWLRQAKVPMLVLNATTLNTGHGWQFTASWMGEPPVSFDEQVDASRRLRRLYYRDAPDGHREPQLGKAVAASACVPALFPPVTLEQLYDGIDVELVDGGVYDNQGIASLLEQDCTVILVSDASGQIRDDEHPARGLYRVANRANSILMSRVRGAQYSELWGRRRSDTLRGLMVVHLKKGLAPPPRDWSRCQEPYDPADDAPPPGVESEPSYAIDSEVQRALSELRTDLDAFSDDEAYALMAAGYEMTRCELSKALPGLPEADPAYPSLSWPFTPTLEKLAKEASQASQSGLAEALRPGRARFFRGSVARRLRRARAGDDTTAAAGGHDRSAGRDPRRQARVVVADVVSPVRKIASAPLALAAALGTRLHLRARRRIGDSS